MGISYDKRYLFKDEQFSLFSMVEPTIQETDRSNDRLRTPKLPMLYGKKTQIRHLFLQGVSPADIAQSLHLETAQVTLYLRTIQNHMCTPLLERLASEGNALPIVASQLGVSAAEATASMRLTGLYPLWRQERDRQKRDKPLFYPSADILDKYAQDIISHRLHRYEGKGVPNYLSIGEMAYLFYVYDLLEKRGEHRFSRLKEVTGLDKNKIVRYCQKSHRVLLRERKSKSVHPTVFPAQEESSNQPQ